MRLNPDQIRHLAPAARAQVEAALAQPRSATAKAALALHGGQGVAPVSPGEQKPATAIPCGKARLRQDTKGPNKLESAWFAYLQARSLGSRFYYPAPKLPLANGLTYTPNCLLVSTFNQLQVTAYEVKGPWVDGDAFPKLKMAASVYPWITFMLVWREKGSGVWRDQRVLP